MSKTWLITSAFCKAELLYACLRHLYKEPMPCTHVIIDNHYPVDQAHNSERIKALATIYGCTYVDSGKDLGLHEGINNAALKLGFKPGDVVVGCDPDDRPTPGFIHGIEKVLRADPTLAVLALNFWVIPWRMSQPEQIKLFHEEEIAGETVIIRKGVECWTVAGFNWDFVAKAGGFNQPNKYYGGLEIDLYHKWHAQGLRYGYLKNHSADGAVVDREDRKLFDPEYREWKTAHVNGDQRSFKEWLDGDR